MAADAGVALTELRVDGGAATNDMLMQFQADRSLCRWCVRRLTETTALGAAYLAASPSATGRRSTQSPAVEGRSPVRAGRCAHGGHGSARALVSGACASKGGKGRDRNA